MYYLFYKICVSYLSTYPYAPSKTIKRWKQPMYKK